MKKQEETNNGGLNFYYPARKRRYVQPSAYECQCRHPRGTAVHEGRHEESLGVHAEQAGQGSLFRHGC